MVFIYLSFPYLLQSSQRKTKQTMNNMVSNKIADVSPAPT